MARRKGGVAAPKSDTDQQKSSWKDKLSEQQLNRKRAADRQLVRENRNRARQTIAVLEERVHLLSSQQPDKLVAELLRDNASLEAEKSALRERLQAVLLAAGLSREQSNDVIGNAANSEDTNVDPTITSSQPEEQTRQEVELLQDISHQLQTSLPETAEFNSSLVEFKAQAPEKFDLITELDSRMAIGETPSPFPEIFANLQRSGTTPAQGFSDDEFYESLILWRQRYVKDGGAYDIARRIFHIQRAPTFLTKERLSELVHKPDLLEIMLQQLELQNPQLPASSPCEAIDYCNGSGDNTLALLKKEMAVCAFEAVRPWNYCSPVARITMFWALYRILALLVFPTPRNLSSCPVWYRPLFTQMCHPHPSFVDLLLWPRIRAHLDQNWRAYVPTNLFSAFVENFDIRQSWRYKASDILHVSANGFELELNPSADSWFSSLDNLYMRQPFVDRFPEFTQCVHVMGSEEQEEEPGYHLSNLLPLQATHPNDRYLSSAPSVLIEVSENCMPIQTPPVLMNSADRMDALVCTLPAVSEVGGLIDSPSAIMGDFDMVSQSSLLNQAMHTPSLQLDESASTSGSVATSHNAVPEKTVASMYPSTNLPPDHSFKPNVSSISTLSDEQDNHGPGSYPEYHIDRSLTEWQMPTSWAMQVEESVFNEFLFSF